MKNSEKGLKFIYKINTLNIKVGGTLFLKHSAHL